MSTAYKSVAIFVISLGLFIAIDSLWLGVIMKDFYHTHLHEINKYTTPHVRIFNMFAAFTSWMLIILGLMLFVLPKANMSDSYRTIFGWGACFGFIVYGVYNLTNLATIKAWPEQLVIYDLLWGTFASGTLACSIQWLNNKL